jgi:hypothetical protein
VSDPTRIREEGSDAPDELRALFRSAARPEPLTPAVQAGLSRRIAGIGAAPAPGFARWLPWLLGGSVALAAGGAVRTRVLEPAGHVARPAPVHLEPAPPAASVASPALAPRPTAPTARVEPTRPAAPAASPRPGAEDGLVGEAHLLNEAHQALASNPKQALALAQDHARRYPHGQLGAERDLIEIQALVKLSRWREAEARGRALRRAAPNSIYEERLDEILRRR